MSRNDNGELVTLCGLLVNDDQDSPWRGFAQYALQPRPRSRDHRTTRRSEKERERMNQEKDDRHC